MMTHVVNATRNVAHYLKGRYTYCRINIDDTAAFGQDALDSLYWTTRSSPRASRSSTTGSSCC